MHLHILHLCFCHNAGIYRTVLGLGTIYALYVRIVRKNWKHLCMQRFHKNGFINNWCIVCYAFMFLCISALMIYAVNARMFLGMANNLCIKLDDFVRVALLIIYALCALTHFTLMYLAWCSYLHNFRFTNNLCIICENCSPKNIFPLNATIS